MSRLTTIAFVCISLVLVGYLTIGCDAHRIQVADLGVAASEKHQEWAKGDESDHHASEHGEQGKKSDEGYDVEHGYVYFEPKTDTFFFNWKLKSRERILNGRV